MDKNSEVRIGMEAAELAKHIFITKELTLLEVVKYVLEEKPHFAEAKKLNPKAKRTVAKALQHTPDFKNSIVSFHNEAELVDLTAILSRLRDIEQTQVEVTSYLDKPEEKIWVHEALSVVSRVRTQNGYYHIPLLDMDLPINEASPGEAEEVAHGLGINHGAIINSGKSYHFWGLDLLAEDEWRRFMYRALLLDRVDSRWIGHRLLDGHASLRISQKRSIPPKVIHVF